MRIAYVSPYPLSNEIDAYGGVSTYAKILLNSIPFEKEDEVHVICQRTAIYSPKEYVENSFHFHRVFGKNIFCFWDIFQALKSVKPEIIHIQHEVFLYGNLFNTYIIFLFLLALVKYRIIITIHGVVPISVINRNFIRDNQYILPECLVKWAYHLLYKGLGYFSTQIIVHSEYFQEILCNDYGIFRQKIITIPHLVPSIKKKDRKTALQNLNIPIEKKVLFFMGFYASYKGLECLIDAYSEIASKAQNTILVIGAGLHPRLKQSQSYLQMYANIKFKAATKIPPAQLKWVGFIPECELSDYFSLADWCVFPYKYVVADSGPLSMAIGYEVPFLLSSNFDRLYEITGFKLETSAMATYLLEHINDNKKEFQKIYDLKKHRSHTSIGMLTYKQYLDILTMQR